MKFQTLDKRKKRDRKKESKSTPKLINPIILPPPKIDADNQDIEEDSDEDDLDAQLEGHGINTQRSKKVPAQTFKKA